MTPAALFLCVVCHIWTLHQLSTLTVVALKWTCNRRHSASVAPQKAATSIAWLLVRCFRRLLWSCLSILVVPHGRKIGWLIVWLQICLSTPKLGPSGLIRPCSPRFHSLAATPQSGTPTLPSSTKCQVVLAKLYAPQLAYDIHLILLQQRHFVFLFKPCAFVALVQSRVPSIHIRWLSPLFPCQLPAL